MQSLVSVCGFLLLIVPVHAHIVKDFEGCRQYFYRGVFPVWPPSRYHVEICQTYENKYHFATLYDTRYRIPVYSAYVFEPGKDHPKIPWCVEPQLVKKSLDMNMMCADDLDKKYKIKLSEIENVQAVREDYQTPIKSLYNRGHLNPKGHHTGLGSRATFTLTNVVPQYKQLNSGEWLKYEEKLRKEIFDECHKAFVVVGAIPSPDPKKWIKRKDEKRVNIPDYMWHAFCCVDTEGKPVKSGATTAKNTENKLVECSLQSLQQFFEKLGKKPELFKDCGDVPPISEGDCTSVIN